MKPKDQNYSKSRRLKNQIKAVVTNPYNVIVLVAIAQQSVGIISDRTILANHPWVDDAESEQKQLEKEQQAAAEKQPQFQFSPKDGVGDGSSG